MAKDFGKNAPKPTIKGKPADNMRNDSPGPGAYNPSQSATKDRTKTAKIS